MDQVTGAIVGRVTEMQAIGTALDAVAGGPRAVILSGPAGIGKSTLWSAAVTAARYRGFTVMSARPAANETWLSYAALADLLGTVDDAVIDTLPAPQRSAVRAVLLRESADEGFDARSVATGFLSIVRTLTAAAPVVVAIDDLQWADEPSARVLRFATRRAGGPVLTLIAQRTNGRADGVAEIGPPEPSDRELLDIGPLAADHVHELIARWAPHTPSARIVRRIAELAGGNPFYARELARIADAPSDDMLLPSTIRHATTTRLQHLSAASRRALAAAAALAQPRVELVARAVDGDLGELLRPAEDAGIVTVEGGMIRFDHPLIAHAISSETTSSERRRLHRRLSTIVDDPEERAHHLALAALGPDRETVAALTAAADNARRRGAPESAAHLLEQAVALGAGDPQIVVDAAHDQLRAGRPERAATLIDTHQIAVRAGPHRARALQLLGMARFQTDASEGAIELLQQALDAAADDLELRVETALQLCASLFNLSRIADCPPFAAMAVADAERSNDAGLLAEALATEQFVSFLLGAGVDTDALQRAVRLEDPRRATPVQSQPSQVAGRILCQLHQLETSAALFRAVRDRCVDRGTETDQWQAEYWIMRSSCELGDVETAGDVARRYRERAVVAETPQWVAFCRLAEARFDAWIGAVDRARRGVAEALQMHTLSAAATMQLFAAEASSMAEISVGNFAAAAEPAFDALRVVIAEGYDEPAAFQMTPDVVEALVALGRIDDAELLIEWLEASGAKPQRPWARAVAARCRGLVALAAGDAGAANEHLTLALAAHDDVAEARYGRARTLLVAGRAARRAGRRRVAATRLEEAAELFRALGCAQWARTCETELAPLPRRTESTTELTAAEHRVAELAVSGITNREIAASLYLSTKTVESHLSNVYRKLGIRNRTQLGQRWTARSL